MSAYQNLYESAKFFTDKGLSLIPLVGGPNLSRGKKPALPSWKRYMKDRPTQDELFIWFHQKQHQAFGIICGDISQLIVLDLDSIETAIILFREMPNLMETLIIQSGNRKTPHIYWHTDFSVKTQPVTGGDLKGSGSYVVGPTSKIAGKTWNIIANRPIRKITAEELNSLLEKLTTQEGTTRKTPTKQTTHLSKNYAERYKTQVNNTKERNNTLFNVTRDMRDAGHTIQEAIATLANIHAKETQQKHPKENYTTRHKEAIKTIESVYTHPAQREKTTQHTKKKVSKLPNTLREKLLKHPNGTAVLRVIEGLTIKDIKPKRNFTEAEAQKLLKGTVGRHAVLQALKATNNEGEPYIESIHPTTKNLTPTNAQQQKHAFLLVGQNQTEAPPPHRPAKKYIMPDIETLCRKAGVKVSSSDPIELEDLKSSKKYRQALHREFLRRRPGQYASIMLANRVNITTRTLRRYNRDLPITVTPNFLVIKINWKNLERIPFKDNADKLNISTNGHFLEDEYNKRYPPKRQIAEILLRKRFTIFYKMQTYNYYYIVD